MASAQNLKRRVCQTPSFEIPLASDSRALAAGNPARIVKMRFDEDTVNKLLHIAWWDWSEEEIAKAMEFMLSPDIHCFIQYCESHGELRTSSHYSDTPACGRGI